MTITLSNMGLIQSQDGDNARTYINSALAGSLSIIDTHDHSLANNSKGRPVNTIPSGGLTITAGGLTVSTGNIGVGQPAVTQSALQIYNLIPITSGTTQYGLNASIVGSASGTSEISAIIASPQTQAASFTAGAVAGLHCVSPTKGVGSNITTAYGIVIDSIVAGATNNYGVYIGAPSSGLTTNLGLYNAGTTALIGAVQLGNTAGTSLTGYLRLLNSGGVGWRNAAGTDDGYIYLNNTDQLGLTINGTVSALLFANPSSGQTGLSIIRHNGTSATLQQVTLGIADSGGAGFKLLRVPN